MTARRGQLLAAVTSVSVALAVGAFVLGLDLTVEQFATSVASEQSVEIARMRDLLPS
ncbi:hypothetical protein [Micromonospora sp. NPDC049374]|uniref:hypothetical protein n=1 Tax=Micromonospora sp. NPDC049374 TaxID=3154352 RepID=UPI00342A57BD